MQKRLGICSAGFNDTVAAIAATRVDRSTMTGDGPALGLYSDVDRGVTPSRHPRARIAPRSSSLGVDARRSGARGRTDERRFFSARNGVGVEAPTGWTLSHAHRVPQHPRPAAPPGRQPHLARGRRETRQRMRASWPSRAAAALEAQTGRGRRASRRRAQRRRARRAQRRPAATGDAPALPRARPSRPAASARRSSSRLFAPARRWRVRRADLELRHRASSGSPRSDRCRSPVSPAEKRHGRRRERIQLANVSWSASRRSGR